MKIDLPGVRIEKPENGTGFLFEERYGFIYLLNETGYELAKLLIENDLTEEELQKHLEDKFDMDRSTDLQKNITEFLSMLREYDLIL